MKFVSPALKHFIFPALSDSGLLRYTLGAGPAIVTYHGVFPRGYQPRSPGLDGNLVYASCFRQQVQLLKKHYDVVSPEDFLSWIQGEASLPPRAVLLTCDDALQNTLTEMVPILRESGLSCLFFATGASAEPSPLMLWYEELYLMLLDGAPNIALDLPEAQISTRIAAPGEKHARWWNLVERLSQFDAQARREFLDQIRGQLRLPPGWTQQFVADSALGSRFLTLGPDGLRRLTDAGMKVGAHTLSHPVLAKAGDELAWREIAQSRAALEGVLGTGIWAFAYPFGNASTITRREVRLAEQAGFRCAFTNVGGGFGAPVHRFAMPRVHVTAAMNLPEFEAHLSGCYRWLRERLLGKREELGAD